MRKSVLVTAAVILLGVGGLAEAACRGPFFRPAIIRNIAHRIINPACCCDNCPCGANCQCGQQKPAPSATPAPLGDPMPKVKPTAPKQNAV